MTDRIAELEELLVQRARELAAAPQEWNARLQAALYRIADAAVVTESLDELYRAIHEILAGLIPATNLYIAVYDPVADVVSFPYYRDAYDAAPQPRKSARSLTEYVLRTGQTQLVSAERRVQLIEIGEVQLRGTPPIDWLGVPLKTRGQTIGVLAVQSYDPQIRFGEIEKEILTFVSSQIALVIARKQAEARQAELFEAAEQRAAELEALRKASLSLTSSLDLPHVLDAILEHTLGLMPGLNNAHVFLYRDDRLTFGSSLWRDGRRGQSFAEPRPEGLTYRVARAGESLVIPDMHSHPLYAAPPQYRDGAIVGLPLKIGDRVVGVMNAARSSPHDWTEAELRVLRLLADQAAVAIENAQLHEEIHRHAEELEQRVAARTAELQAANEALQEAAHRLRELDVLKSQFVANVSHELRTPLTNIITYLYLLDRGKPEKRGHYMTTLHHESEVLQRLIEDLLQISRFDLSKAQPVFAPVDVNGLIAILAAERSELLLQRGLTLHLKPQENLPPAWADQRMLLPALSNLLTNAMSYTPRGGTITLSTGLQTADSRLQIGNPAEQGASNLQFHVSNLQWVTFSVRDTGPGMTAEDQTHIFERFYRGDAARQANIAGTGLGLSICQEIVKRHNGRITVESEPGQGSTFTVWLPAVGPENEGKGSAGDRETG
ncbi:MAG: GAF domain-containing protein [Chloroflexi bacterium]|nr:GAF domain-containing protein [Chloroflexota bacterium]